MNFPVVEAALQAWLVTATGLTANRVVLANASIPQPAMPYMTVKLPTPRVPGGGPLEVQQSYNAGGGAGQEVVTKIVAQLEASVSVQAFTLGTVGSAHAREYILAAIFALARPDVHDALYAAGLALVDIGDPFDFTAALGPVGQGRCALDVKFRIFESVTAPPSGYIATVNVIPVFTGP